MKKIFALVLAVAMIAGLAATALATVIDLGPVSRYSSDDREMTQATATKRIANYGGSIYYQIKYNGQALDTYSDVEKLKVKATWSQNGDLVKSVSVVKKNIAGGGATPATSGDVYAYFLEISLNAATDKTVDSDVIGTLVFTNSSVTIDGEKPAAAANRKLADNKFDIGFTVFYGNNYEDTYNAATTYFVTDGSDITLKWGTDYAFKFDYDDEVDFVFGFEKGGENEGTFTVNVAGQGKVYMRYSTTLDKAIAAVNPDASIKALNFGGATFNKTGTFLYEWDDAAYIYEVVDGQLYTMPKAVIADGEVTFTTRTLGSYVISDIELFNPEVTAEPEVEAPEVNNPTTGAAA